MTYRAASPSPLASPDGMSWKAYVVPRAAPPTHWGEVVEVVVQARSWFDARAKAAAELSWLLGTVVELSDSEVTRC